MAALSAVFRITSDPNWQDRFEIEVLQQGWRAGGKCASGRDRKRQERNYEHGLHILGGFYHNTFALLRDCYDEWGSTGKPWKPLPDAVSPHDNFYLMQPSYFGFGYERKFLRFPLTRGQPGREPTELSPLGLLERVREWLDDLLRTAFAGDVVVPFGLSLLSTLNRLEAQMQEFRINAEPTRAESLKKAFGDLAEISVRARDKHSPPADLTDLWVLTELVARIGWGFVADEIYLHGFDAVDQWDAIEWLKHHHATELVTRSTYVTSGYDYAFAFVDGEPAGRDFAAGVALRGMLRLLLTYHAAPFFHMQGGMGEIVIMPIYEVLRHRGVKFRFFHRVTAIRMQPGDTGVRSVEVSVQARLKPGLDAYDPIMEVDGRRFWPTGPLWEQLTEEVPDADFESWWYVGADEQEITLAAGEHFDVVLSGIPIAALDPICSDFRTALPGWSDFVDKQQTTPTIAVQYWLSKTTPDLGNQDALPLVTGFVMPASTWCDMSFLLRFERSVDGKPAQHLSYGCGPFPRNPNEPPRPDNRFQKDENARAELAEQGWNDHLRRHLLPDLPADDDGDFPTDPDAEIYVRANVGPSDRYALSVKGSIASRPKADGLGLSNFFVCGDWTRTGTNVGAVESAVTSGFQAARAITGTPQYVYGETDFP